MSVPRAAHCSQTWGWIRSPAAILLTVTITQGWIWGPAATLLTATIHGAGFGVLQPPQCACPPAPRTRSVRRARGQCLPSAQPPGSGRGWNQRHENTFLAGIGMPRPGPYNPEAEPKGESRHRRLGWGNGSFSIAVALQGNKIICGGMLEGACGGLLGKMKKKERKRNKRQGRRRRQPWQRLGAACGSIVQQHGGNRSLLQDQDLESNSTRGGGGGQEAAGHGEAHTVGLKDGQGEAKSDSVGPWVVLRWGAWAALGAGPVPWHHFVPSGLTFQLPTCLSFPPKERPRNIVTARAARGVAFCKEKGWGGLGFCFCFAVGLLFPSLTKNVSETQAVPRKRTRTDELMSCLGGRGEITMGIVRRSHVDLFFF